MKARGLRAALAAVAALGLAGCANLPFFADKPEPDAASTTTASAAPAERAERADYRLEVLAPDPLPKLLTDYLDLARFQSAPATEAIERYLGGAG